MLHAPLLIAPIAASMIQKWEHAGERRATADGPAASLQHLGWDRVPSILSRILVALSRISSRLLLIGILF